MGKNEQERVLEGLNEGAAYAERFFDAMRDDFVKGDFTLIKMMGIYGAMLNFLDEIKECLARNGVQAEFFGRYED